MDNFVSVILSLYQFYFLYDAEKKLLRRPSLLPNDSRPAENCNMQNQF